MHLGLWFPVLSQPLPRGEGFSMLLIDDAKSSKTQPQLRKGGRKGGREGGTEGGGRKEGVKVAIHCPSHPIPSTAYRL